MARYLADPAFSFQDYKRIAEWLGCYEYKAVSIHQPNDPIDKFLLIELTKLPNHTLQSILDKILFIRGFPNGYKTKAVELLRIAQSAFLSA